MELAVSAIAIVSMLLTGFFGFGTYVCYNGKDDPVIVPSDKPVPWTIMVVLTVLFFCISIRYWVLLATFN